MERKLVNSQLSNFNTYLLKREECFAIAENVFQIDDLPVDSEIDLGYVNSYLTANGSIAWFVDEELGLLALPYTSLSGLDLYGRPVKIQVIGQNGYSRILRRGEFVIMYDNTRKVPIKPFICQYAERLSIQERVKDINISQQRTPRIWKTNTNKIESIKKILNEIDGNVNEVIGFEDIIIEDLQCILQPAPFVADKVNTEKEKTWNEFLRFVGVSNLTVQKKERTIKDEINSSLGGTIVSRFNRYTPRKEAIEKINKLFGYNLKLKYYDGLPSTTEDTEIIGGDDDVQGS